MKKGKVYLVGAGPGEVDLLTVKGKKLLEEADVLVYDYLASPDFLGFLKQGAEKIYVGKKAGQHTKSQTEINEILVAEAKKNKMVVRLKGGDPYIFGRGAEEGEFLHKHNITFEVVPGVSSVVAAAAYAGIPLTHRNCGSQVLIMAGHESEKEVSAHNWEALAKIDTLVAVMGVKNLASICQNLIKNGKDKNTKAALIQWGTTNKQKTVVGNLETLAQKAKNITPPALLVIGEVVSYRKYLNFFEERPLWQKKVLVTRSRKQKSELSQNLKDLGATVIEKPTIEIEEKTDFYYIFKDLKNYNYLVFTSPNGVEIFFKALFSNGYDTRLLGHIKIAVIGPGTEKVLNSFFLKADLKPKQYVAESLLEAFENEDLKNKKIILARAEEARDVLPKSLVKLGAEVKDLKIYKTINPIIEIKPEDIDLVTFTSSSTALGLSKSLGENFDKSLLKAVVIGPITGQTAQKLGFKVIKEAQEATVNSLTEAIVEVLKGNNVI